MSQTAHLGWIKIRSAILMTALMVGLGWLAFFWPASLLLVSVCWGSLLLGVLLGYGFRRSLALRRFSEIGIFGRVWPFMVVLLAPFMVYLWRDFQEGPLALQGAKPRYTAEVLQGHQVVLKILSQTPPPLRSWYQWSVSSDPQMTDFGVLEGQSLTLAADGWAHIEGESAHRFFRRWNFTQGYFCLEKMPACLSFDVDRPFLLSKEGHQAAKIVQIQ